MVVEQLNYTVIIRACCLILLFGGAVLQLQSSVNSQLIFSNQFDKLKLEHLKDARVLTFKAKQRLVFDADASGALLLIQHALKANPYYVPAWLRLAELYNDMGQKNRALAVLEYTDKLTKDVRNWRWDKAMVAYQLENLDSLSAELRYIISEIPGKERNDALQLAFTMWKDPGELIRYIGQENINHLFNHAVQVKLADQALYFSNLLELDKKTENQKEVLGLVNMLLSSARVEEAIVTWRKYLNPEYIVYNGNFSNKILNQAFGWRMIESPSFEKRFERNSNNTSDRSIQYRFKGWDNLNFRHLYQIIPVIPGRKYELSVEMKTEKLTTDQRPYLEVYGYKCQTPRTTTRMVDSDQDWAQSHLTFNVSDSCNAVVVCLRRNKSLHIDNKLQGRLWLRNVAAKEVSGRYPVPGR